MVDRTCHVHRRRRRRRRSVVDKLVRCCQQQTSDGRRAYIVEMMVEIDIRDHENAEEHVKNSELRKRSLPACLSCPSTATAGQFYVDRCRVQTQ